MESSQKKAITIYNSGCTAYSLDGHHIAIHNNGANDATTTQELTGSLAAGESKTICATGGPVSGLDGSAFCDMMSTKLMFNGNDAVTLTADSVAIDRLGTVGDASYYAQDQICFSNVGGGSSDFDCSAIDVATYESFATTGVVSPATCPCSATPCENSGTCIDTGATYSCSCAADWTGANCDAAVVTETLLTLKTDSAVAVTISTAISTVSATLKIGATCIDRSNWCGNWADSTCSAAGDATQGAKISFGNNGGPTLQAYSDGTLAFESLNGECVGILETTPTASELQETAQVVFGTTGRIFKDSSSKLWIQAGKLVDSSGLHLSPDGATDGTCADSLTWADNTYSNSCEYYAAHTGYCNDEGTPADPRSAYAACPVACSCSQGFAVACSCP
jgi:hypothetical protein